MGLRSGGSMTLTEMRDKWDARRREANELSSRGKMTRLCTAVLTGLEDVDGLANATPDRLDVTAR